MIVYGDPSFTAAPHRLLAGLRTRLHAARGAGDDELRTLLIHAGQAEQAISDSREQGGPAERGAVETVERDLVLVTDAAARAFVLGASGSALAAAEAHLDRTVSLASALGSVPLRVKVPEGFAFYSLYPEQYVSAAAAWAQDHPPHPGATVGVVGLRSIGTTLSAVVSAALRTMGWRTRRTTVRPHGHPFSRTAEIPCCFVEGITHALVVDEGPGLSGSSLAAVVRALERAGLRRSKIALVPGHGNNPGAATSNHVRRVWNTTSRYVADSHGTIFGNGSLIERLADRTRRLLGRDELVAHDLCAGGWRALRPDVDAPVFPAFERTKHLISPSARPADGVLWKFGGLAVESNGRTGAQNAHARLLRLSAWTAEPRGVFMGFVATPWIAGATPRANADAPTIAHLGRYIAAAARSGLSRIEHERAVDRLRDVLVTNTREALGENAAARAHRLAASVAPAAAPIDLAYGDGHLAPHEWILRAGEGRSPDSPPTGPLKLDAEGHCHDHTIIGEQSVAWDLAGAIVEWNLGLDSVDALLRPAVGAPPDLARTLSFYRGAYAAFRLGLCALTLASAQPNERERLDRARRFYTRALRAAIETAPTRLRSARYCSHTTPTDPRRPAAPRSPKPG